MKRAVNSAFFLDGSGVADLCEQLQHVAMPSDQCDADRAEDASDLVETSESSCGQGHNSNPELNLDFASNTQAAKSDAQGQVEDSPQLQEDSIHVLRIAITSEWEAFGLVATRPPLAIGWDALLIGCTFNKGKQHGEPLP